MHLADVLGPVDAGHVLHQPQSPRPGKPAGGTTRAGDDRMQAIGADHDAGRDRVTSRVHDAAHHTRFAYRASDPHALAHLYAATTRDLDQGRVQLGAGNGEPTRGSARGVAVVDQVAGAARRADLHAAQPTSHPGPGRQDVRGWRRRQD